jgi:flagellar biosynthesis/type III secretory pathway protein FliH
MTQPTAQQHNGPRALFAGAKDVELPPWQGEPVAPWTPLRLGLREVDDPDHSAKQHRIRREARSEELRRETQAGFDAGFRNGLLEAKKVTDESVARYAASLADLGACRAAAMQQTQTDVVRLALHVAGQVLLTDVSARHAFTCRMVDHGLELLADSDTLTLRLSPTDLAAVLSLRPELRSRSQVQLVEDPSIVLGGVVVQSKLGRVDATVERRLAEMAASLLETGATP